MTEVETYLECVEAMRLARIRFAQQFAIGKSRGLTDGAATQYAIEQTEDELTTLQAQVAVARLALGEPPSWMVEHGL